MCVLHTHTHTDGCFDFDYCLVAAQGDAGGEEVFFVSSLEQEQNMEKMTLRLATATTDRERRARARDDITRMCNGGRCKLI